MTWAAPSINYAARSSRAPRPHPVEMRRRSAGPCFDDPALPRAQAYLRAGLQDVIAKVVERAFVRTVAGQPDSPAHDAEQTFLARLERHRAARGQLPGARERRWRLLRFRECWRTHGASFNSAVSALND